MERTGISITKRIIRFFITISSRIDTLSQKQEVEESILFAIW